MNFEETLKGYQEELETLRQKFGIRKIVPKTDSVDDIFSDRVHEIIEDPIPNSSEDAYTLFRDYYSSIYCIRCKENSLKKYRVWNKASLEAEISYFEEFKEVAAETRYRLVNFNWIYESEDDMDIYLKFDNGYVDTFDFLSFSRPTFIKIAEIYGKYFLYYEWLKNELRSLIDTLPTNLNDINAPDEGSIKFKPKASAYAIMHIYLFKSGEGPSINEINKGKLGSEYGFAGITLLHAYNKFKEDTSRTTFETDDGLLKAGKKRMADAKMEGFKEALILLKAHPKALELANKDFKILENNYTR